MRGSLKITQLNSNSLQISDSVNICPFAILAVVTLQTFTSIKAIYLGQIHQKSPEVNSSRVLFYLGEKFWEGYATDIGYQGFQAS